MIKPRVLQIVVIAVVGICLSACILPVSINALPPNDLEGLFLEISEFPEGWSVDAGGPASSGQAPFGGAEYLEQKSLNFYAEDNVAFQDIRSFRRIVEAGDEFERQIRIRFREGAEVWVVAGEIHFRSIGADRYRVACRKEGSSTYCLMVSQYKFAVISFGARINSALEYDEFNNLLAIIDTRASEYLERP